MIIILEGSDNSGKSTLAKQLNEDLEIAVSHPGGPPKNIIEVIARCQEQSAVFALSGMVDVIMDRATCISDFIYRNAPEYDKVFDLYLQNLRYSKNVVIVYCRPSDKQLLNFENHVMQDHEDESVVEYAKENAARIISDYDKLFDSLSNMSHFDIFEYDFEAGEPVYQELLAKLLRKRDYT